MKEKHPEFVSRLEEHGLTYIKIMSDEVSSLYFGGSDWKSAYMTDDKNVAEERCLFYFLTEKTYTSTYTHFYIQCLLLRH